MRMIQYTSALVLTFLTGVFFVLVLQQFAANTTEPSELTPEETDLEQFRYRKGEVVSTDPAAKTFTIARSSPVLSDENDRLRVQFSYDERTTFLRQRPILQDAVMYRVESIKTTAADALTPGSPVWLYYGTDRDGSLFTYYVVTGNPLFIYDD